TLLTNSTRPRRGRAMNDAVSMVQRPSLLAPASAGVDDGYRDSARACGPAAHGCAGAYAVPGRPTRNRADVDGARRACAGACVPAVRGRADVRDVRRDAATRPQPSTP